jgi:hypothetical protein
MKRLPHIVPTVPQRPSSLRRLRKLFCGAAGELSQERRNEERVPWDAWYDAVGASISARRFATGVIALIDAVSAALSDSAPCGASAHRIV